MSSPKQIITNMDILDIQKIQSSMKSNNILVIKFGAEWCKPCKQVYHLFQNFINQSSNNVICADIDIDENINLYIALKKFKMVNGIPVFLSFYGNKQRDKWYIPDDSVIGTNETDINNFLKRCEDYTKKIKQV